MVAVFKAQWLQALIHLQSVGDAFCGQDGFAPNEQDHAVNGKAEDEVDDDPPQHDDEALPRRLGSKFPRLRRLLHLLGIHRLIDHPGDFDVAPKWQPTNAPFGLADLLFEERKTGVHEEVKFLHPGLERTRRPVVTKFVKHHQNGQAEQKLSGFDECDHGKRLEGQI